MEAASQPAALVTRSWVGRVRVVGSADVIDAFVAWQKTVRFDGSALHRDSNEAAPSGAASVLTAAASGRPVAGADPGCGPCITTRRMLRQAARGSQYMTQTPPLDSPAFSASPDRYEADRQSTR